MSYLAQDSSPCVNSLAEFMTHLELLKQTLPGAVWRDFARKDLTLRKWRYFLALDPYTRWGLLKPRGYPGDARLMDFAYRHPSVNMDITSCGDIGRAIFDITSGAKQSQSARQRIQLVATEIETLAANCNRSKITIMSFASGHARELLTLSDLARSRINAFLAIDSDPVSLDEVARSANGVETIAVHKNIVKDDLRQLNNADLVYSLGLFDYLNDEVALSVLAKMWSKTKTGGVMLIANLAPTAANLGYCEAVMDWWMIPRTESELQILSSRIQIELGGVESATVQQHGCFNYLRMVRA